VPSLPLGSLHVPDPSTGVDDGRLDDDVSILEELADAGSRVGVADLGGLLGVEPDLPLADAGDVGGQSVGWRGNGKARCQFRVFLDRRVISVISEEVRQGGRARI
jgi:hypothetical protein